MRVADYYKHFVSLFGALTAVVASVPLIAQIAPEKLSSYLFPPLGPVGDVLRGVAILLVILVTLIAYFAKDTAFASSGRGRVRVLVTMFVLCICGALSYMVCSLQWVPELPVPSMNEQVFVSVGYERSQAAKVQFPDKTDVDILRLRGTDEEEIQRWWTLQSIITARVALFVSYLILLLSAIAVGSFAVLFDKLGRPPNP